MRGGLCCAWGAVRGGRRVSGLLGSSLAFTAGSRSLSLFPLGIPCWLGILPSLCALPDRHKCMNDCGDCWLSPRGMLTSHQQPRSPWSLGQCCAVHLHQVGECKCCPASPARPLSRTHLCVACSLVCHCHFPKTAAALASQGRMSHPGASPYP